MNLYQRPDQRLITTTPGAAPGSRSGSPETALSLQQAGIPPLVPGLKTAEALHQQTGKWTVLTMPASGAVWGCVLSYAVVTNSSFTGTAKTYAQVTTASGLSLGVVELAIGNNNHEANGQSPPLMFGVALAAGDVITLDINGASVVTNLDQRASAIVFYTLGAL